MDSFIDAYKDFWRRYAQFGGRTSVGGYWRAYLINILAVLVPYILAFAFAENVPALALIFFLVVLVYGIAIFVPSLAIAVRRLHDTDKSGAMVLLGLIPLVGPIILLVFYCTGGTPGNNQYGPQPLGTQWTTDQFPPGAMYVGQIPGGTPPPPPPSTPS